jgi:hypothetical protein
MLLSELKEILANAYIDWEINVSYKIPERLYLKDYIPLKCKKCGNKKHHTLGNIKHTFYKNPNHCRCRKCHDKAKAKATSDKLLDTIEKRMLICPGFPWYINKSKIKSNKIYSQKTPVPLKCKTCQSEVQHTPCNITSCIKNNGHIKCQVCKLRNAWKEKIKYITSGSYELDVQKTALGFKIIHKKCGYLKIFKEMFHGQFYPVNPETKIMVRQSSPCFRNPAQREC